MKKIFMSLLTVSISVIMFGCTNVQEINLPQKNSSYMEVENAVGNYLTFEQLLGCATDIIKGKCINMVKSETYIEYEFSVLERYMGEDNGSTIYVYVPNLRVSIADTQLVYNTMDVSYRINDSYFLVLSRTVDVYLEHDRYMNVGANIFLPVDDLSNCSIYGQSFSKHSALNTQNVITSKDSLSSYFNSYKNNTPNFWGMGYIKTNDVATIIKSSDFIMKIKVKNEVYAGIAEDRNTFDCVVVSSLKGDVVVGSTVRIVFPKDSVTKDTEYFVALYEFENVSPRSFVFSSKNSLFNTAESDVIMKYVFEQ